jgi:hypothetical protein
MATEGDPLAEAVRSGSTDQTGGGWSYSDLRKPTFGESDGYDLSLSTAAAMNDRPSLVDSLDFTTYIDALYQFITHEETGPPLTVSIDGEWGVGKSSFMLQLEYKLRKAGHFTVHFNPWLHQGTDALWGAFMLSVLQQISGDLSLRDRLRGRLRLYYFGLSSDWTRAIRPVAATTVTLLILASVLLGAWVFGPEAAVAVLALFGVDAAPTGLFALGASGAASLLGAVTWLTAVLKWSQRNVVDPVQSELRSYLVSPRYEDHVSFIEHFHDDLALALEAYTGPHSRRIFVFIDDLDRCDVQQAAELMESINLLLSDDPRLVFLIGMDREKVSAGIAAKYERILRHLGREHADPTDGSSVEFGEDFIDKFVQVPFAIPRPNTFSKFGSVTSADGEDPPRDIGEVRRRIAEKRPVSPRHEPPPLGSKTIADISEGDISTEDILKRAEQALDYNPRRVKKFVNLFRLYLLIAEETDVLSTDTEHGTDPFEASGGRARNTRRAGVP